MKLTTLALISTLVAPAASADSRGSVPVINDDYPRARAEATRRKLPLFVEVWAPW